MKTVNNAHMTLGGLLQRLQVRWLDVEAHQTLQVLRCQLAGQLPKSRGINEDCVATLAAIPVCGHNSFLKPHIYTEDSDKHGIYQKDLS